MIPVYCQGEDLVKRRALICYKIQLNASSASAVVVAGSSGERGEYEKYSLCVEPLLVRFDAKGYDASGF